MIRLHASLCFSIYYMIPRYTIQGYEFVRDAVRHCLFEGENITLSGKLVDIFAIKVETLLLLL